MKKLAPNYSRAEKEWLSEKLPQETELRYNHATLRYEVWRKPCLNHISKLLRSVKRYEVKEWVRKQEIMSYVARRALYDNGYTAAFRTQRGSWAALTPPRK